MGIWPVVWWVYCTCTCAHSTCCCAGNKRDFQHHMTNQSNVTWQSNAYTPLIRRLWESVWLALLLGHHVECRLLSHLSHGITMKSRGLYPAYPLCELNIHRPFVHLFTTLSSWLLVASWAEIHLTLPQSLHTHGWFRSHA